MHMRSHPPDRALPLPAPPLAPIPNEGTRSSTPRGMNQPQAQASKAASTSSSPSRAPPPQKLFGLASEIIPGLSRSEIIDAWNTSLYEYRLRRDAAIQEGDEEGRIQFTLERLLNQVMDFGGEENDWDEVDELADGDGNELPNAPALATNSQEAGPSKPKSTSCRMDEDEDGPPDATSWTALSSPQRAGPSGCRMEGAQPNTKDKKVDSVKGKQVDNVKRKQVDRERNHRVDGQNQGRTNAQARPGPGPSSQAGRDQRGAKADAQQIGQPRKEPTAAGRGGGAPAPDPFSSNAPKPWEHQARNQPTPAEPQTGRDVTGCGCGVGTQPAAHARAVKAPDSLAQRMQQARQDVAGPITNDRGANGTGGSRRKSLADRMKWEKPSQPQANKDVQGARGPGGSSNEGLLPARSEQAAPLQVQAKRSDQGAGSSTGGTENRPQSAGATAARPSSSSSSSVVFAPSGLFSSAGPISPQLKDRLDQANQRFGVPRSNSATGSRPASASDQAGPSSSSTPSVNARPASQGSLPKPPQQQEQPQLRALTRNRDANSLAKVTRSSTSRVTIMQVGRGGPGPSSSAAASNARLPLPQPQQANGSRTNDKRQIIEIEDSDNEVIIPPAKKLAVEGIRGQVIPVRAGPVEAPRPVEAPQVPQAHPAHQAHQAPGQPVNEVVIGEASGAGAAEQPKDDADPLAEHLSTVLSMIPDVHPEHVLQLFSGLETTAPALDLLQRTQFIIESLLDSTDYPRTPDKPKGKKSDDASGSKDKGKGKRTYDDIREDEEVEEEINYLDEGRAKLGYAYVEAATEALCERFPKAPKPHIRSVVQRIGFYAHAYRVLEDEIKSGNLPYRPLQSERKGKGRSESQYAELLEKEDLYMRGLADREKRKRDQLEAERLQMEEDEWAGLLIECGCCFGDFQISNMVQCPEAHLFCVECARRNAEEIIGNRKTELFCMDGDGCRVQFTDAEATKFLRPETLNLLAKIRQEKEIDQAELLGLEKCPFCPFACIIENDAERLFHCQNEDCEKVSCRTCKKINHLPATCEEANEDGKMHSLHRVEEAMTEALVRTCPKCKQKFIKEDGCNKMVCPNCRTLSCYVCGEVVTGYDHFANAGPNVQRQNPNATCPLWDDTAARHHQDVERARQAAAAQAARDNPAIDQEDLQRLNIPAPPPARQPQTAPAAVQPPGAPARQPQAAAAVVRRVYELPRPHDVLDMPANDYGGRIQRLQRLGAELHAVPANDYAGRLQRMQAELHDVRVRVQAQQVAVQARQHHVQVQAPQRHGQVQVLGQVQVQVQFQARQNPAMAGANAYLNRLAPAQPQLPPRRAAAVPLPQVPARQQHRGADGRNGRWR